MGFSLLSIFTLFLVIGETKATLNFDLKKINPIFNSTVLEDENLNLSSNDTITGTIFSAEIASQVPVAVSKDSVNGSFVYYNSESIDSTKDTLNREKVLLIGDSQLEGLRNPAYDYCEDNHYKLVSTIIWYGSSTEQWSNSDTLDYFVKKYNPSIILFAIGLNELYAHDLDNRKHYIANIISRFKKYGVRYLWIGPAAWTKDKGIIDIMKEQVGKQFYPSELLTLERETDHRHPTRSAARIWFDSVAVYSSKNGIIDFSKKNVALHKIQDSGLILLAVPN